ncbi:MAG: NADH-quinone oxidoreductase subunit M [Oligoflexia bacterium]|nr:NADH-quinone oxidoreductase subunit M [Oligoflexia bacterium]
MNFDTFPFLSSLVFLPLVGALVLYLLPFFRPDHDEHGTLSRGFALFVSLVVFAISLLMLTHFDAADSGYQFSERADWIPYFGISYFVGLDGISVWLVLLTTFLMPLVVIASASVHKKIRGYLASMLVLETAMIGTLVALDVFLFYVFWELMLAPMYFIIGIWGGKRRIYATLKFVLYTVVGSLLMLVAIFYVVWRFYEQQGHLTFLLDELQMYTNLTRKEELWMFAAFALAFGIKVPLFPFHTWLPDAHVEAPTGGSVVLAGVLLKMGLYGYIRFAYPLFPRAADAFAPYIATLAVIGIVYGALVAWAQSDIKKLVAYSSVSHLGYCVLGFVAFNAVATSGAMYQMLNHGISTGALFLLVGVLYDRKHTRLMADYGGLAAKVPLFAFLFLVFTLSSIALPLTNGFIGEFLILTGSFKTFPVLTVIGTTGVVLGAVYMLTLYMKTMYGELDEGKNGDLTDVNGRELATFLPLLVMVFWMGIYPQPFLSRMEPTLNAYFSAVAERRAALNVYENDVAPSQDIVLEREHQQARPVRESAAQPNLNRAVEG